MNDLKNLQKMMDGSIKRGDIFYIKDVEGTGHEQGKNRPAIIIGNDIGNEKAPIVIVVYMTSQEKKPMPTHALVKNKYGQTCTALCEQIDTVDKSRLGEFMKSCTEEEMKEIDKALAISIGLSLNKQQKDVEMPIGEINVPEGFGGLLKKAADHMKKIKELADKINQIDQAVKPQSSELNDCMSSMANILSQDKMNELNAILLKKISEEKSEAEKELAAMIGEVECHEEPALIEKEPEKEEKHKKKLDTGKIIALSDAGWSAKAIALECNCSVQAVYDTRYRMKNEAAVG